MCTCRTEALQGNTPTVGSWAHGLYVLTTSLLMLNVSAVELIDVHCAIGDASTGGSVCARVCLSVCALFACHACECESACLACVCMSRHARSALFSDNAAFNIEGSPDTSLKTTMCSTT